MWRFGEYRLGWSPGHQGKGYVTADEDINTWNVDANEAPHHQEEWERVGETSQPAFLFDIYADGGIHDGGKGFRNTTGKDDTSVIAFIRDADPRLYDASSMPPDYDLTDDNPTLDPTYQYDYPIGRDEGFGHAYRLLDAFSDVRDPVDELYEWLQSFPAEQEAEPPSIHHNSEEDFIQQPMASGADYPAILPPDQVQKAGAFNILSWQDHGPVDMPNPPQDIYPNIYHGDSPRCSICGQPSDEPGPCPQCASLANATKTGSSSPYSWVAQHSVWGYHPWQGSTPNGGTYATEASPQRAVHNK